MSKVMWHFKTFILFTLLIAILTAQTGPVEGIRSFPPRNFAFIHGHIHTSPDKMIEDATVIFKDGIIVKAGARIKVPANTTVIDLKGKHVYAGFIDGFLSVDHEINASGSRENWNEMVQSGELALDHYSVDHKRSEKLLSQGFTTAQAVLNKGIFAGQTSVIQLDQSGSVLDASVAQAMAFRSFGRASAAYPGALLGSIALMRQTLLDASWYAEAQDKVGKFPNLNEAIAFDRHLDALSKALNQNIPFLFSVGDNIYALRAAKIAKEFNLKLHLAGSGYEYKDLKDLKKINAFIYVPLNFPGKPEVTDPFGALEYSTAQLKHWDIAPDNAKRMDKAGLSFGFTANGLKDVAQFKTNINRSVERGLSPISALAGLTTNPAKALGLDEKIGKIEEGFVASFVITDGEYFESGSRVAEVWVAGAKEWSDTDHPVQVQGEYALTFDNRTAALELSLEGTSFSGNITLDTTKISLDNVTLDDERLSWSAKLNPEAGTTRFRAHFADNALSGTAAGPFGEIITWSGTRMKEKVVEEKEIHLEAPSDLDVVYPDGAFGFNSKPNQPKTILINDATIWTSGPEGILEDWDILIEKGKITRISRDLSISVRPDVVIDGRGKHVTPGMFDAHSHMAASSINEGSQSITSEVRIQDVLNSSDMTIYRQLAGGTTMSNILHGSANTIGGQNAVIKLRWGGNSDDLIYKNAPQGIKFALGENVKQSNWGDDMTTRYPQTRMGVEQILRDAFTRAQDYRKNHADYNKNSKWKKTLVAPRIDLELEALVEIMEDKRFIHCHSYRQDEILMLMRVAEDFGFRIKTFQHILEGYKVADTMADHGVGGSTFSDWWAYKFEVYDAIPYNGTLMADVGVVVSFNSDDDELGRRLNLEAAKGVKYGGMSEIEALKTVTLNPAIQMGVDKWTGSLEIGKDADFVVWNGSPLSSYTVCEQTWVDGRQYFSLEKDAVLRKENADVRNELIQKILKADDRGGIPMEPDKPEENYSCRDHSHSAMEEGAK